MAVSPEPAGQLQEQGIVDLWDSVLELTKSAQDKKCDPLLWAVQLSSTLNSAGVSLPSLHLAHLLVSHICWDNHLPITWKFLEKAITANIVPPLLVIALLSTRSHFLPCCLLRFLASSDFCLKIHATLFMENVSHSLLVNSGSFKVIL